VSEPISPPPVTEFRPEYLPAYISNGLVGLRCGPVPFLGGICMVSGFVGLDPVDGVEGFSRAPFPLAADVQLDGVRLSEAADAVHVIEQRYDFSTAELTSRLQFSVGDTTADLEVVTFCSRTRPTVVLQELRITSNRQAEISISVGVDPGGIPGGPGEVDRSSGRDTRLEPDGVLEWRSHGGVARCGIAYRSELLDDDASGGAAVARTIAARDDRAAIRTTYRFRARSGRSYRVRQMTSLVPDLVHRHPGDEAARLQAQAALEGWDALRAANRAAWRDLWRSRIEVDGASRRWQSIIDASLFYLLTSVHPSSSAGTSLFGLAYWPNYHYYRGHVMWDIETFLVPPLILLQPEAAESILDYRVRHLDAARANARIAGWRGAMYPWESSPIHGEDVTPGATPPTKDHLSFDVAIALASFSHATGNRDRLRRWAWPVIEAVAEFAVSRVERSDRGYEIRRTIGPAEIDETVDNDAFVNMAAARALLEAAGFARQLGEEPPGAWETIAAGLVIPMAARGGHIVNHDRFRIDRLMGDTPEGAAGLFPVGFETSEAVARATFRFAAERQAPTYVGTPMLSGFLSLYAARAGLPALATELLETGYGNFVDPPFMEIDEYTKLRPDLPRASPMLANIGAFLTTLLYGYPGLRLGPGDPSTWFARPVVMPSGWRGIHVERVWIRGEAISLTATAGAEAASLE
jgi:hypothetical protein